MRDFLHSLFFFCCSIKIYWCCSSWLTSACRNALEQESLELLRTFVLYPTLTSDLCGCPHPSILGWNQHWQTYMYVIHVLARSVHGWLLHSIAPGAEVSAKQHVTITDHHLQRKLIECMIKYLILNVSMLHSGPPRQHNGDSTSFYRKYMILAFNSQARGVCYPI